METQIKELSMAIATTDLSILLAEIKYFKRHLALELDLARDRRQKQEREFQEIIKEFRQTLAEIQAQFRVEAQLLKLVRKPNAGDEKRGKEGAQTQAGRVSSIRQ
jgi:hypothetical protein